MKLIESEKFIKLVKAAQNTEYFKDAGWSGSCLLDVVNELENGDGGYGYDDDMIFEYVEALVYEDESKQLPKEMAELVDYIYGIAIESGNANMTNDYGALFYTGRIGEQNFEKAAYYYQKASDMGCSYAIENLGYIYYYGRIGEVNYEKAYQQFSKGSAVYNRACSTYKLGDMFKNGYYVSKDIKSAYECYKRAEKLIDNGQQENRSENVAPDIYFRLAEAKQYGGGTDKDLMEALAYYHKAEIGFITKIKNGDFLVKKMLTASIDRQEEVRTLIAEDLPAMEWAKKNTGYSTK